MKTRRRAAKFAALAFYIIVILVAAPQAQQFSGAPGAMMAGPAATTADATEVDLLVGRSTILNVGSPIARVSLTVPDVADAMVTAPQQILIHGKTPGIISLFVWDRAGGIKTYEVSVRRDLTHLIEQVKTLFPGEQVSVVGSGKDVVLSGTVSSKYVVDKAAEVAGGYVDKKENVVNLLKVQEGIASNQVMLRVRFAEVSRSALTELGANLFTGPTGYKDWIVRSTTQQFSAPNFSELTRTADLDDNLTSASGKYSLSDFLNLFIFNNKYNIGTVIRALQEKGLFQSLAEPNLIASNGKEASFLAGGEYPYPISQPSSGGNAVTIMFKEFGVRLNFTPTVLGGDMINLKVRPEVSSLDFSNAITLEGFRVPAIATRRTETEVELADGQTFAIAGLMNNTVTDTMRKIPGIGDIPILGWLFKSKAMAKNQTELVVMITPHIVKRGAAGVSSNLPSPVEPYMAPPSKTHAQPEPWVGSPRYPAKQPSPNNETYKQGTTGGQTPRQGQEQTPNAAAAPAQNAAQPTTAAPMTQPTTSPEPTTPEPTTHPSTTNGSTPTAAAKPDPKELERLREAQKRVDAERKKAEADQAVAAKKAAEEKAVADKKAAEEKVRQDKLDAERAKREAEVAKKNQAAERKRQEELKKHEKTVAEAAARLKEAQKAYEAEMKKKKGV